MIARVKKKVKSLHHGIFRLKTTNLMQILGQLTNFKISEEGIWKKKLPFFLSVEAALVHCDRKWGNKCSTKILHFHKSCV